VFSHSCGLDERRAMTHQAPLDKLEVRHPGRPFSEWPSRPWGSHEGHEPMPCAHAYLPNAPLFAEPTILHCMNVNEPTYLQCVRLATKWS
jgi:hypothetical protein